ncbi:MAG TPA: hypothetical protein VMV49_05310 [Candidatus Deferrimicrobium sp.]|nr:hypothetical protein [Candidatus Deferrimicrobium sp.]
MTEYPLAGPYRITLMSLEVILLFIFIEISTFFFYKYYKNKKEGDPSVVELDWGIIFLAMGISYIFFLYGDYFAINRDLFLLTGYIALVTGGILFVYHIESTKMLKTNYYLTAISCGFLVVFLEVFFLVPSVLQTAASLISFFAFGIIIFYFLIIIRRIWGFYRSYSIGLFVGIMLWLIGYTGTADAAVKLFNGLYIRVIGDSIIIIGMILVAFFVNLIPSLAEIGWRDKIKYVILSTKSGIDLYNENFQEHRPINEVLVSGAIWGIQIFLQNVISDSKGVKVISKGNDVVILDNGNYVIGILIVEQELEILKYLLKKLIFQFEEYYSPILQNWKGDLELFKPTKYLISSIFSLENI